MWSQTRKWNSSADEKNIKCIWKQDWGLYSTGDSNLVRKSLLSPRTTWTCSSFFYKGLVPVKQIEKRVSFLFFSANTRHVIILSPYSIWLSKDKKKNQLEATVFISNFLGTHIMPSYTEHKQMKPNLLFSPRSLCPSKGVLPWSYLVPKSIISFHMLYCVDLPLWRYNCFLLCRQQRKLCNFRTFLTVDVELQVLRIFTCKLLPFWKRKLQNLNIPQTIDALP